MRIQKVFLDPPAMLFEEADQAIRDADLIIIGPGDPYTSVIPNLLVVGMSQALQRSHGKKIMVTNLMSKWGETHGFVASDMAHELLEYSGLKKFDYIICNTAPLDPALVAAYEKEKKYPIHCDPRLKEYGEHVLTGDFFSEADIARHDSEKIARIISEL